MSRKKIRTCENCMNAFDCDKKGKLCKEHMLRCERRVSIGFLATEWEVFAKEWDEVAKRVGKLHKQKAAVVKEDNDVRNTEMV